MINSDSFRSAGQPASSFAPTPLRRSRLLQLGISGFLALLLSGCSGSSDPAIVGESPTSQPRGTLLVEPASFTLSEGATISLRAKLGSQTIGASQLTWSISPSNVATVDAQGTLTAIRHGEATVTARYSSLQATAHGTVWPIPRSIEALSSISLAGIVGRPLSDGLQVKAISSEGVPVPGVEVSFEVISGNGTLSQSVRTTGSDGVARVEWTMGTVPGQQQARARAGQLGELNFGAEVTPDYATATVEILAGDGQASRVVTFLPEPLKVRVVDQFGNVLPGLAVEWKFSGGGGSNGASGSPGSASPSVTTTTGAQGTTEVHWKLGTQAGVQEALCTPSGGLSGSSGDIGGGGPSGAPPAHANPRGKKFVADAEPDAADSVSVTPDGSLTVVEATEQLSASLVDQYGNTLSGGSFAWTTDASGVVAVDNTGLAYGLKVGKAEVFAEDSGSNLKGSAWVNVESRAASAVQKGSGDGQAGMVNTPLPNPVAVRVVDQVGSPVAGVSVGWSVLAGAGLTAGAETSPSASAGGPGAALTLTDSDGVAQTTWTLGTQAGQQTLEASVEGFSPLGFTAEATPGAVASITVTPAAVEMEIDKSQQFSATAKDEFGNTVTGATLTWSSSNTAVASVSSAGLASAVAAGSAEIRATSGSVSGTAAVTVKVVENGAQVASVTISPAEVTLEALEEKAQLTAVAEDSFGNPVPGDTIAWLSLDSSIATVDQMGVVTAKTVGLALIVASVSCCDVADTVAVRVTQVPAEVFVSPSSYTLAKGEAYQLSGVVKDAMGYVIPGLEVVWSSDDASIASVDGAGIVTGWKDGTTQVRGVHSDLQDPTSVTVTDVTAPPPGTEVEPLFWDSFESGDLTKSENGWSWAGSSRVSDVNPRTGTHSMGFTFGPNELGEDSWAEQRFAHSVVQEWWTEYYIYYPDGTEGWSARYVHRNDAPTNNKFLCWWKYKEGMSSFGTSYGNASNWRRTEDDSSIAFTWSGGGWTTDQPFIVGDGDRGRWIRIRVHVRPAPYGENTGLFRLWKDDTLLAVKENVPYNPTYMEGPEDNGLSRGYIMGWANSGFTEKTVIHIDDFKFYDTNPGW